MISSNYKAFCWFLSDVTKTLPIFWKQIIIFNERSKTDTNIFGHDLAIPAIVVWLTKSNAMVLSQRWWPEFIRVHLRLQFHTMPANSTYGMKM